MKFQEIQIETRNITISSVFWKLLENIGVQLIGFVIQIFLARLLFPSDFGTMALVSSLLLIMQTIIQIGFSSWLIQADKVNDIDYSSNFYLTLVFSVFLFIVFFTISPLISDFYNESLLKNLVRTQSIGIIISSFYVVRISQLRRELKFKQIFKIQIISTIIQGVSGILFALNDLGVWTLVYSNLLYSLSISIFSWLYTKNLKFKYFSIDSISMQMGFSSRILFSGLLDSLFNLYLSTIIFKYLDATILGYYNRGSILPILIISNIYGAINSVMFPIISKSYNNNEDIKFITRRVFQTTLYFIVPAMFGLIVLAQPIVYLLFGYKWVSSAVYLQVISFTSISIVFSIFTNTLNAMGRSDITFNSNLFSKIASVLVLQMLYRNGVNAILAATVIYSLVNCIIQSFLAQKYIKYQFIEQIKDLFPILLNTLIMSFLVFIINYLTNYSIYLVLMNVFFGIVIYIIGSIVMKIEIFGLVKETISQFLNHYKT